MKSGKEHRPMQIPRTVPINVFYISGYCPSSNHYHRKERKLRAFVRGLCLNEPF